jgi:hypothetical protein
MSPREKHIPDDASRTSICLTAEDRAAINWISIHRRLAKNKRFTINDVLIDALWLFLEKSHGVTRDQIQQMIPQAVPDKNLKTKVTQMPKPKNNR